MLPATIPKVKPKLLSTPVSRKHRPNCALLLSGFIRTVLTGYAPRITLPALQLNCIKMTSITGHIVFGLLHIRCQLVADGISRLFTIWPSG